MIKWSGDCVHFNPIKYYTFAPRLFVISVPVICHQLSVLQTVHDKLFCFLFFLFLFWLIRIRLMCMCTSTI